MGVRACPTRQRSQVEDLLTGAALHLDRQGPARLARPARATLTPSGGSCRPGARRPMTDAWSAAGRRRSTEPRRQPMAHRSPAIALWYKDAIIYQLHIKAFFDANGDGIGDFAGLMQQLDYIQELGVNDHLAAAVLSLAAARRRLRHRRLPPRQPGLRHDARLPALRPGGPPARPPRHHRARHQPHLGPASLVPARAAGQAAARSTRDYYVWSDTDQHYPETRIIFIDTEKSNWTWDPVAQAYFWHRFYSPPARPQLRQSDACCEEVLERHALSGSTWGSTGCGSTPSPTWSSARAPTTRTCPRPTTS